MASSSDLSRHLITRPEHSEWISSCEIRIHQCSDLKALDCSNPYVKINIFNKDSLLKKSDAIQTWKTPIMTLTSDPIWDASEATFLISPFTSDHIIHLSVWNHSIDYRDECLGALSMTFEELLIHNHLGPFRRKLKPRKFKEPDIQGSIVVSGVFPMTADRVFFVWNGQEFEGAQAPSMLRACSSPFIPERVAQLLDEGFPVPSRDGLAELRISGSAQFGRAGLEAIIGLAVSHGSSADRIVVCDLRGEPHMILNGYPVSWYNRGDKLGSNLPPVECDELTRKYFRSLSKHNKVDVHKILTKGEWGTPEKTEIHTVIIECLETEEMLCHREFHMGYNRVPITDHEAPEICDADQLVAFYQSSPPSLWWHFHCAGGKGRTTTAMVCIDMLLTRHSFPNLTAQDFINRQWLIGGLRLDVPDEPAPEHAWKHQDAHLRRRFIELFYQYTRDRSAHKYGLMFFSTWIKNKSILWPPLISQEN
jgi:hypothetical protein